MFWAIKLVIIAVVVFILLFCFYIFSIKPGKRRDTSYFEQKKYAHRGLHDDEVPENSLTAFRLARENGYGVELDVQMTSDGRLVVFHDGNLKRMCGVDGKVKNYTYDELQEFRLKDTDECIPLFSDVLDVLWDTDLICEIKGENGARNYVICEKVYDFLKDYRGRYCIESFSPFLVYWFRKNHPEIIRGQLSCGFKDNDKLNPVVRFVLSHLMTNLISRPDFVAYNHEDSHNIGFRIIRRFFRPFLVAWTAKGEEQQKSAEKVFDSVIFEKNPPKENKG